MKSIFLLWFVQEREQSEDTELLIGAYRTQKSAEAAIEKLKSQPGFRDFPEGFAIDEYELDKESSWSEGFVKAC